MEIYENKHFNSDDDCATVRGDESETEHTDFPAFNKDGVDDNDNNDIVNYGIKYMKSLGETFNNFGDELTGSKSLDCIMENSSMDIIDSIDNNDDYSISSISSDGDYNINDGDYHISITVNTKSESKKGFSRIPPSKRQLISKSNVDNGNDDVKQKKMKNDNKDKVTKTRRLTRSPNNKKKQPPINKSLKFQSTKNFSNSNKRKFIYKVNEIDKNDIFVRDRAGQTNLHRACQEGKLDRVKDLVDKGSDINACDNAGWTSLHEAAYHGYLDIVLFLLENGSEVNAISYDELDTPLHDACAEGHEDIVRALLEYGADPEKTNVNEKKPGDYTTNKNIIKLLGTPVEVVKTPVKKSNFSSSIKRPVNGDNGEESGGMFYPDNPFVLLLS
ncbi:12078_t:CDS:2 [Entrophospora sp. SA101]|nr:12078_t:CDS:2 [Entrophospora sp. SA101]CAJ0830493.1 13353_t:CDS:2 [Entrophospora sp. SA101]